MVAMCSCGCDCTTSAGGTIRIESWIMTWVLGWVALKLRSKLKFELESKLKSGNVALTHSMSGFWQVLSHASPYVLGGAVVQSTYSLGTEHPVSTID